MLALLAFLTARGMFGTGAGLITLVLIVFEPNLLAHGAMVTTDTGAACFLLASIYAFYRYVKSPSWGRIALLGIAAGAFFITKHSAVLLPPMLILLAITELLRRRQPGNESRLREAVRFAGAFLIAGVLAWAIVWIGYGLRYSARPAGMQINPPLERTLANLSPVEGKASATMPVTDDRRLVSASGRQVFTTRFSWSPSWTFSSTDRPFHHDRGSPLLLPPIQRSAQQRSTHR